MHSFTTRPVRRRPFWTPAAGVGEDAPTYPGRRSAPHGAGTRAATGAIAARGGSMRRISSRTPEAGPHAHVYAHARRAGRAVPVPCCTNDPSRSRCSTVPRSVGSRPGRQDGRARHATDRASASDCSVGTVVWCASLGMCRSVCLCSTEPVTGRHTVFPPGAGPCPRPARPGPAAEVPTPQPSLHSWGRDQEAHHHIWSLASLARAPRLSPSGVSPSRDLRSSGLALRNTHAHAHTHTFSLSHVMCSPQSLGAGALARGRRVGVGYVRVRGGSPKRC